MSLSLHPRHPRTMLTSSHLLQTTHINHSFSRIITYFSSHSTLFTYIHHPNLHCKASIRPSVMLQAMLTHYSMRSGTFSLKASIRPSVMMQAMLTHYSMRSGTFSLKASIRPSVMMQAMLTHYSMRSGTFSLKASIRPSVMMQAMLTHYSMRSGTFSLKASIRPSVMMQAMLTHYSMRNGTFSLKLIPSPTFGKVDAHKNRLQCGFLEGDILQEACPCLSQINIFISVAVLRI